MTAPLLRTQDPTGVGGRARARPRGGQRGGLAAPAPRRPERGGPDGHRGAGLGRAPGPLRSRSQGFGEWHHGDGMWQPHAVRPTEVTHGLTGAAPARFRPERLHRPAANVCGLFCCGSHRESPDSVTATCPGLPAGTQGQDGGLRPGQLGIPSRGLPMDSHWDPWGNVGTPRGGRRGPRAPCCCGFAAPAPSCSEDRGSPSPGPCAVRGAG